MPGAELKIVTGLAQREDGIVYIVDTINIGDDVELGMSKLGLRYIIDRFHPVVAVKIHHLQSIVGAGAVARLVGGSCLSKVLGVVGFIVPVIYFAVDIRHHGGLVRCIEPEIQAPAQSIGRVAMVAPCPPTA